MPGGILMIQYDSHVHTSFSTDSDTPMEEMVRTGIQAHLQGITFTDHMDYHFPSKYIKKDDMTGTAKAPFSFDFEKYLLRIKELKDLYSGSIQLYCGVEMGLKEDAWEPNWKLSQNPALDYVIGSVHLVNDIDPYYPEYWESYEEKKALLLYFETTLKNLEQLGELQVDTLGHLDYIVRYSPSGYRLYSYHMFADVIDAILAKLIERNICLEINTAGYKNGGTMPNPGGEIIRRYRDLGGQWITFGSDAHTTGRLAADFEKAEKLAVSAGFDSYLTFVQRTPVVHPF